MPLPGVPAGCVHVREAQVEIPAFAAAALRLPDPFVLIHEAGEVRLRLGRQRAHDAATDGDDEPPGRASRIGGAGTAPGASQPDLRWVAGGHGPHAGSRGRFRAQGPALPWRRGRHTRWPYVSPVATSSQATADRTRPLETTTGTG